MKFKNYLVTLVSALTCYMIGAISYRLEIFPLTAPLRSSVKERLIKLIRVPQTTLVNVCPVVDKSKLKALNFMSKNTNIEYIFWGDSVVEGMHDSRYYGVKNFVDIAQGGQIVYCALKEIEYILNLNPKKIIIYLGGNDADGQSSYGPKAAAAYYDKIINILQDNNIEVIIHQIHGASTSRNQDYVLEFNKRIENIGKTKNLKVLPPLAELTFDEDRETIEFLKPNLYSYDGEHLKPDGYKIWIESLKKEINSF